MTASAGTIIGRDFSSTLSFSLLEVRLLQSFDLLLSFVSLVQAFAHLPIFSTAAFQRSLALSHRQWDGLVFQLRYGSLAWCAFTSPTTSSRICLSFRDFSFFYSGILLSLSPQRSDFVHFLSSPLHQASLSFRFRFAMSYTHEQCSF